MVATAICLVAAVLLYIWHPLVALGFVGGVITGAGTLSALVLVSSRVVAPQHERTRYPGLWAALHVGKFALVAGFAYLVIIILAGNVAAFAAGYTVALIVLFVIMLGERSSFQVGTGASRETPDDAQDSHDDVTGRDETCTKNTEAG